MHYFNYSFTLLLRNAFHVNSIETSLVQLLRQNYIPLPPTISRLIFVRWVVVDQLQVIHYWLIPHIYLERIFSLLCNKLEWTNQSPKRMLGKPSSRTKVPLLSTADDLCKAWSSLYWTILYIVFQRTSILKNFSIELVPTTWKARLLTCFRFW